MPQTKFKVQLNRLIKTRHGVCLLRFGRDARHMKPVAFHCPCSEILVDDSRLVLLNSQEKWSTQTAWKGGEIQTGRSLSHLLLLFLFSVLIQPFIPPAEIIF